ncbi:MAG: TIGR00730 family Rossman fold protein [Rubellimicrobium sp.]|jgi:uncharacterized protein (TIGR00730 family)|nr:TIGR00730 family Rossman fold protein [Rubellimicrobium sp.]
MKLRRLCVFCGSNAGASPDYVAAGRALGRMLAGQGIGVVYGAGGIGVMAAVADGALEAGGEVVGVIPRHLWTLEVGHRALTELHVVESMHERKNLMAELADGFVALPGGIGTLEEFFEVWTWGQLKLHHKPVGLLNVGGYFDRLLDFLGQMVAERFLHNGHHAMMLVDADPARLVERMAAYQAPEVERWFDRART